MSPLLLFYLLLSLAPYSLAACSCPTGMSAATCTSNPCTDGGTCTQGSNLNKAYYSAGTYTSGTGIYAGTLTTNACSQSTSYGTVYNTTTKGGTHTCCCCSITIPGYTGPIAAPLRMAVGYSLYGVNIYGPLDAGFTAGSACTTTAGVCDSGTDAVLCTYKIYQECGSTISWEKLLDICGGHATPYHYHTDLSCDYTLASSTGHSPLLGIMLDGRGLYGQHESTDTEPTDLDLCNGHTGTVPAGTIPTDGGTITVASSSVYHYHTTGNKAPFTIGCYGPVTTLAACKALYSTCSDGYTNYTTSLGTYYNYDADCPCFRLNGVGVYNQVTATTTSGAAVWGLSPFVLLCVLLLCLF